MGDEEANQTFPDSKQRYAFCNSQYDRKKKASNEDAMDNDKIVLMSAAMQGPPRVQQLMGRDFMVVPAVLVQGQVLHNNLGSTLLSPEDITDAWAAEWNGAPVVVSEHPTSRGMPTSARTPDIMNRRGAGFVFSARVERNGTTALKGDVWLDLNRASQIEELQEIVQRLRKGERVELSTGFPTLAEETPGVFNGEAYEMVLHPHGADHLAIFAHKTGACSVEDGCGLGVQERQLTTEKEFVVDEKDVATNACERKEAYGLMNRIAAFLFDGGEKPRSIAPPKDELPRWETSDDLLGRVRGSQNAALSDQERMQQIGQALDEKYGGKGKMIWIDALYSEQSTVVFGVMQDSDTPDGGRSEKLFRSTYEIGDNAAVSFSEPEHVTRRIMYEPAPATNEETETMPNEEKKVTTPKGEEPKVATNEEPKVETPAEPKVETPAEPKVEEPKADEKDATIAALQEKVEALAGTINAQAEKIASLESATAPAVAERDRERQSLVAELAANEKVPFDQAELESKPVEELRKLRAMSRGESYAGRGGPQIATQQAHGRQYAQPVPYFAKDEKKEEK